MLVRVVALLAFAAAITIGSNEMADPLLQNDAIIEEEAQVEKTEPGMVEDNPGFFNEAIVYTPTNDNKGRSDLTPEDAVIDTHF